jgi:site-specific DNA-methyltransferase (adenine-specific)
VDSRPWQVLVGDCRTRLAELPPESIDAHVGDPPYGLSTVLDPPRLDREKLWRRILEHQGDYRPLRDYVLEAVARFMESHGREPTCGETVGLVAEAEVQRDANAPAIGRLIRSWLDTGENPELRGGGFMGREWDLLVPAPNTWRAIWRVLKPGAPCIAAAGSRMHDLLTLSIRLAGFEIDDSLAWLYGQGFPKRARVDLLIDSHLGREKDRPVLRKRPHPSRTKGVYGKMAPPDEQVETGPASDEAARFVGWDRNLRPGHEPIVFARKPLRGTIAANALAHGTGGLHVDACRLPRDSGDDGYPANVALDEASAAELDQQSGILVSGARREGVRKGMGYGSNARGDGGPAIVGDEGGASRFFYCAKASTSERDAGLEDLPSRSGAQRTRRKEGSAGVNAYAGARGDGGRNPHETVKPLSLMRWLIRLASPPGAWDPDAARRPVILDAFAGSGTTLVAGLIEGVRVIGCELADEFADVARRRCQHAYALPRDEAERLGDDQPPPPPGAQASLFPVS